jgi:hypothetical protein
MFLFRIIFLRANAMKKRRKKGNLMTMRFGDMEGDLFPFKKGIAASTWIGRAEEFEWGLAAGISSLGASDQLG